MINWNDARVEPVECKGPHKWRKRTEHNDGVITVWRECQACRKVELIK